MHNSNAISFNNVSKVYKLHKNYRDQLVDVLGLNRIGFKPSVPAKEFSALKSISLEVPRGHRIGVIGRNGAGKTTLLKLICGNFSPTAGSVDVNGNVQALMNVGLGFHPEFTGRQNVEASLQYSGLEKSEYADAMDGIIEFCELGDFLDQPFKTYSLGMQARLMFAAATAIKPDILIVDEVLGAGDAYFVAKSKKRVESLIRSGCTMLLVSHSMHQILELCEEAIWLDKGEVRMQGDSFEVVKAYEAYLHGSHISHLYGVHNTGIPHSEIENTSEVELVKVKSISRTIQLPSEINLQTPWFLPHSDTPNLPSVQRLNDFDFTAPGGISRWDSEPGLKLSGFTILTERGKTNKLVTFRPVKFVLSVAAERSAKFACRYGIAIDDHLGVSVARIYSPIDKFELKTGDTRQIEILLNPLQIGTGEYTIGISVLSDAPIESLNSAFRYDLLSRSFKIVVEMPDTLSILDGSIMHSAEWSFLPTADTEVR